MFVYYGLFAEYFVKYFCCAAPKRAVAPKRSKVSGVPPSVRSLVGAAMTTTMMSQVGDVLVQSLVSDTLGAFMGWVSLTAPYMEEWRSSWLYKSAISILAVLVALNRFGALTRAGFPFATTAAIPQSASSVSIDAERDTSERRAQVHAAIGALIPGV